MIIELDDDDTVPDDDDAALDTEVTTHDDESTAPDASPIGTTRVPPPPPPTTVVGGTTGGRPPLFTSTAPLHTTVPRARILTQDSDTTRPTTLPRAQLLTHDTTNDNTHTMSPIPTTDVLSKRKALEEKHAEMIRRVDDRIRDRASRILANAYLADSITTGDPKPEGWTDRMYRTAQDARMCGKEAPVYLLMAAKTLDSFKRTEAIRPTAPPQLHADVKVYVRGDLNVGPTYKVVDVEAE